MEDMEDDKKNAVTEEVTEIVQQEAELSNEGIEITQPDGAGSTENQDQPGDESEVTDESVGVTEAIEGEVSADFIFTDKRQIGKRNVKVPKKLLQSLQEHINEAGAEVAETPIAEPVQENAIEEDSLEEPLKKVEEVEDINTPCTIESASESIMEDSAEEESVEEIPTTEVIENADEESVSGEEIKEGKQADNHTQEEEDFDAIELAGLSKVEQLNLLKKMSGVENIRKIDSLFKNLGYHYDIQFDEEKKTALEAFLKAEGSNETDFEFKGEDVDQEFHSLYKKLHHKRAQFFQEIGKEKDNNLLKKNEILVILREVIDGEDQESFNKVKRLQEEWKNVGPVPGSQNHSLWANYHALMDRFYDHRSIYFELKELDKKKNLDAKMELCKKAEALDASTNLHEAIDQLNELHEEFKHVGSVPREDEEALWQRFKLASDLVYEKRNEFNDHQRNESKVNLVKKLEFVESAKALSEFDSDRIKIWNSKTKELLELQKQWEAVGSMPRQSAKEVTKAFWGSFKKFFANKNQFFKKLDGQRVENLAKKKELISKALKIRESDDWEATANTLKELQNQWREIGIVPDKYRKSLYEEFKRHCDYFFEKRRGLNTEQNKEFEKNLERKKEILAQLEDMASGVDIDLDVTFNLLDDFSDAGLVPKNAVGKTLKKYDKVCKRLLEVGTLSDSDAAELKAYVQVTKLRNSPHSDQKISRKENTLKRKISGMENDVYNWKRNINFFGRSANAEQMKMDFQLRIDEAERNLESMKQELRLLRG